MARSMRFPAFPVFVCAAALLGSVTAAPARAAGDTPAIDKATRARAAARFREGERAFRRHDYAAAADAFDEAYKIAPHPAALFNAAQAYEKAGELARAANLCARYLDKAPEHDKRRPKANKLLADLVPKLGRIQIDAGSGEDVQIDSKPVDLDVTYVDPGDHVVAASFDGKPVKRHVNVVAGSLEHVLLEAPREKQGPVPQASPVSMADSDVEHDAAHKTAHGLAPAFFYTGVAATVVLGGVTVWSGLDTNSARSDYDQHPTQQGLDDGLAKEHRTNILLGATAVVGVATAVVGLFATNWKPHPEKRTATRGFAVGVAPGSVVVSGRF